jgi:putative ABC transport system permease protein
MAAGSPRRRWWTIWRLRRSQPVDHRLREEIRFHLEQETAKARRMGLTEPEARRRALARFGAIETVAEQAREQAAGTILRHLDLLSRDVAYAVRLLRRRPGLTAAAIMTLTVGIGLNAALFCVVRGVLLRPLPVPNSDRLVRLFEVDSRDPGEPHGVSSANVTDWMAATHTLDRLAATAAASWTVVIADNPPEQISTAEVGRGFFEMLGVRPAIGRLFVDADYARGGTMFVKPQHYAGPGVAVITDHLWRLRFGAQSDVAGQTFLLDGHRVEVIGVLPADFSGEGLVSAWKADIWTAAVPDPVWRRGRYLAALGRLAPGVSLERAQAEFDAISARFATIYAADDGGWAVRLVSPLETVVHDVRRQLWLLWAAAGCVLLIAAANLSNLLLVSVSGRRHELAARLAMGATRGRLVRQVLVESLTLCGLGGVGGGLLTYWSVPVLVRMAPADVPRLAGIVVDANAAAFAGVIGLIVGAGCGLAACIPIRELKASASIGLRQPGLHGTGRRLRYVLTTVQVSLAVLLVIGTGLLVRTEQALQSVDLGFDPTNLLAANVNPSPLNFQRSRGLILHSELLGQIRRMRGVVAAGVGPRPLLGSATWVVHLDPTDAGVRTAAGAISAGYFEALGAHLVAGRFFESIDTADAPHVAVVNEAAARRFWPNGVSSGRVLWRVESGERERLDVVGVVGDARNQDLTTAAEPTVYVPEAQTTVFMWNTLLVRTDGDPMAIVPAVRSVLKSLDPMAPLTSVERLQDRVDEQMAPTRFLLRLFGLFAAVALGLSMVGTYALLAESVAQRIPEIGVRMALGATPGGVAAMIVSQGVRLVAIGLPVGVVAALLARETMATLIFGVPTTDALTYAASCVAVLVAALVACWVPARRAASIDPVVALRHE